MKSFITKCLLVTFLVTFFVSLTLVLCEAALFVIDRSGLMQDFFRKLNSPHIEFDLERASGLYFSHPYNAYEIVPSYQANRRAHINSLGYRGAEFDRARRPGTYRIVALGSSTTYGIYNEFNETYPYQLEQQLRLSLKNNHIEVINAGLVSATTAESLIRFYLKILDIKPDMILIYEGFNDIVPRVFNGFRNDYYHFRRTPTSSELFYSNLYVTRLVELAIGNLTQRGIINSNLLEYIWRIENLPREKAARIKNFKTNGPHVFERNLEQIILASMANKIRIVLSTFAHTPKLAGWTDTVPEELWESGIKEHNAIIRRLASEYNLPLCHFSEQYSDDLEVFEKDSIHLSKFGNEKLAECFRALVEPEISAAIGRER